MNALARIQTSGVNRSYVLPGRRCNVASAFAGSIELRSKSFFLILCSNYRYLSTTLYAALPKGPKKSMPACIQTEPGHRASPSYAVPGLRLTDHWLNAPLDYSGTVPGSLVLFARQVVAVANEGKTLPWLVYLQGGPGFESPRPADAGGWLGKACEAHQVLLLDQRGTGLSTPLTASALSHLSGPQEQAALLALFRADCIVCDAELFRKTLLPPGEKWTLLGQSFGGFCAVTYMSLYPEALTRVLLTGGLPPVSPGCSAEGVYRACFQQAKKQTQKFYARFPQDEEAIRAVVLHVHGKGPTGIPLPGGGCLTVEGLQALGLTGLGSAGGFERLHFLFEGAWESSLVESTTPCLSTTFLHQFESWFQFDTNPLYAVLHEAIYCQGAASKWAAERVRGELKGEFDGVAAAEEGRPVPFTGEMIFPWMFDTHTALRPLKEAAQILAEKEDWMPLYDTKVLAENEVPCAAAVYYEDLYVNVHLAEATAGGIKGIRTWVSSEYQHSGLRENGPRVLERLLGMLSGAIPLN